MPCVCCNTGNIIDCLGCFIEKKTLNVTITTSSGRPFRDTVTTLNGQPWRSLMPGSASMTYLAPPQLFGDALCGPACASPETQICPSSVQHSETSSYLAAWYSDTRECISNFNRYTTYQTGLLVPVYRLVCNSFLIIASAITVKESIQQSLAGGTCPYFDVPNCDVLAQLGGVTNMNPSFQLGIVSCSPLLMTGTFPPGQYGPFPFAGLFSEGFTVTVTE